MSLLIAIIYVAFVSLGLPDSLLGSGWPVMHVEFGVPLSRASVITTIIFAGTIISALFSDRLIRKLGTGKVIAFSTLLTSLSMLGFALSGRFFILCILSVPYGFGAGAIDACLNNYVALHLSSRHMSWLHCCWGIGATISPYIMSAGLSSRWGWRAGYGTVSIIQFALSLVMFAAIPLWEKAAAKDENAEEESAVKLTLRQIFTLPGAVPLFTAFALYCAIEQLPIVWASSYFVSIHSLSAPVAASFGSLYYFGMMAGRAACGIFADRLTDKLLIRYGMILTLLSCVPIILPFDSYVPALVGFVLMGLGCAPVYPSIVHSTPYNFGRSSSQSVIGVLMASAYLGMMLSPIIFGKLAENISIAYLPHGVMILSALILILTERLNIVVKKRRVGGEY